jgi:nucleoside-diphosphate-sugar epimerase
MKNVLISGANGFIGKVLCERMLTRGWQVRGTVRDSQYFKKLPIPIRMLHIYFPNLLLLMIFWSQY